MSVDGYLDDATHQRLILSSDADLDRVDEVRANADAILVGATTIRRDNPWLRVRSAARREARQARGELADPVRVTITRSGNLDPAARFFARFSVHGFGACVMRTHCRHAHTCDTVRRPAPVQLGHGAGVWDRSQRPVQTRVSC